MPEETIDTSAQVTPGTEVQDETMAISETATEDTGGSDDHSEGSSDEYEEFTMPEGLVYDKETATDFLTTAKELGLTQEGAQKLIDLYGVRTLGQLEAQQKQSDDWAVESKKTFKSDEIDLANKTLTRFADAEFIDLLKSTGLGNHPKMVGLFKSIGSQISEGNFVDSPHVSAKSGPMYKNSPGMYK
jgi:hypothetical protein